MDVGVPLGVICALVPSTNPTSTVIYKTLIALKAGNAIIFSPHPGARECSWKAIEIVKRAAEAAGAPAGSVGAITQLTLEATSELMHSKEVSLILATGGEGMVRAAYASGTPTISGGPGNGPAFIERSADIHHAVKDIITSKTFDNGVICASEQSIIVERWHLRRSTSRAGSPGRVLYERGRSGKNGGPAAARQRHHQPESGRQNRTLSEPDGRLQPFRPAPGC
nr:acetaldehyde dehydrogenase [Raoultella sp. NCTC 9187]